MTRELLWVDPLPFDALYEHRVRALVAIRETLAEQRPLEGGEDGFLALYDFAREADAEAFATVWSAPAAEAWTRRTFGALAASIAAPDDVRAAGTLRSQLAAFPLFALALAHVADLELTLPDPIEVDLPVGLVGTSCVIEGRGRRAIEGRASMELAARPVVRIDGLEVWCVPEALAVPGAAWPDVDLSVSAGSAFHQAHAVTLQEALRLVGRYQPETFAQLRDQVRVVALQPEDARKYPNASSSEHPGSMLLGAYADPVELADHVVHEYYHGRLFALEAMGDMLEDAGDERYYSPWRDEPRSMRGLLHGTYVFTPVLAYWQGVERDAALPSETRESAADHTVRIALQLRIAAEQVARRARLTAFGRSVFAELRARIDDLVASVDPEASRAARAAVDEHVRRYDVDRQVADMPL
jgi:HEXXH motif-containing protein